MADLINRNSIDPSVLRAEDYFNSLVEAAKKSGILDEAQIRRLQIGTMELLSQTVKRFTGLENSSVRVEKAEDILKSIFFTVSVSLKKYDSPDAAAAALKEMEIKDIYNDGYNIIIKKLKSAKRLYSPVLQSALKTPNEAYNSTVKEGLPAFFNNYDVNFGAHENIISYDYPLCVFEKNLRGIEKAESYLRALYYENRFCSYFSDEDINALMQGYEEGYEFILVNIFEQVLISALGCAGVGRSVEGLLMSDGDIKRLNAEFGNRTENEIHAMLSGAKQKMLDELGLESDGIEAYIDSALGGIAHRIYLYENGTLPVPVFVKPVSKDGEDETIKVDFGDKMDDESYKRIVEDLMASNDINEKLSIIKGTVNSLGDLYDIFVDAELSGEDIRAVLGVLNIYEVAALRKRNLLDFVEDLSDMSGQEITVISAIDDYIENQLPEYRQKLEKITDRLEIVL